MSRVSKVLPLALAVVVVALAVFAASCGSTSAQYRIVNAMVFNPQQNVDITLNGASAFTSVGYESTEPSTGYKSVTSGSDTMEVFLTGTTTNPYINSALNLSSGNDYTVVMGGNSPQSGATFPYAAQVVQDTNPTPTSGDVEFRILNASPSTPSVDVYVGDPQFGCCPSAAKVASGLVYPSSFSSSYQNVGVPVGPSIGVWVTYAGSNPPNLIASTTYTVTAGQLYTVVLIDQPTGGFPPQFMQLTP